MQKQKSQIRPTDTFHRYEANSKYFSDKVIGEPIGNTEFFIIKTLLQDYTTFKYLYLILSMDYAIGHSVDTNGNI